MKYEGIHIVIMKYWRNTFAEGVANAVRDKVRLGSYEQEENLMVKK